MFDDLDKPSLHPCVDNDQARSQELRSYQNAAFGGHLSPAYAAELRRLEQSEKPPFAAGTLQTGGGQRLKLEADVK
jgi:hypothetical protein